MCHSLDHQTNILVAGKVDGSLNLPNLGHVDNILGISTLSTSGVGLNFKRAGVPLRPRGQDRKRIVDEKSVGAGIGPDIPALCLVVSIVALVADGRWRQRLEKRAL